MPFPTLAVVVFIGLVTTLIAPSAAAAPLRVAVPEGAAHLLSFWVVEFKREHRYETRMEVSDDAGVAESLINGTADIALMLRPLSAEEKTSFAARRGRPALAHRVALDAIALYVHKSNPLAGMSRGQIDALFSLTRRCGHPKNIFWWDELGVTGDEWQIRQIELYGPNARSGERAVFEQRALCEGRHKATLEMAQNHIDLLRIVASNPAAIAYGRFGQRAPGVRQVPVAGADNGEFIAARTDTIRDGRYPLTRFVYLYVAAPALEKALVESVLSPQGQMLAEVNGFVALPPEVIAEESDKLSAGRVDAPRLSRR